MKILFILLTLGFSHFIMAQTQDFQVGDTVIYDDQYAHIIARSENGLYSIERFDKPIPLINNVERQAIASRTGCQDGLCADEIVFDTFLMEYATIVGLRIDESFVIQSGKTPYAIRSLVPRNSIAKTIGCRTRGRTKMCIEDIVVNEKDEKFTIVAFQKDGRLVLRRNDQYNYYFANIEPSSVTIHNE